MIEVRGLEFAYGESSFKLSIPELVIEHGEKVALIGPSGSGKTTFINLIAGILRCQAGSIRVADVQLARASDDRLRNFRISTIGFVFQEFELLEYLTVRDNILLPFYINGTLNLDAQVRDAAEHVAASMGLGDKLRRLPQRLSHGERQRVAICRALITSPPLIIADEPTGNLDPATAGRILDLLMAQVTQRRATLLMVTHNHSLLDAFDRTLDLQSFATRRQA